MRPTEIPRILATSVAAAVAAVRKAIFGRGERSAVQLQVGDPAPDFSLLGSDGRVHRLRDLEGRDALVLAWFPKAFTIGCTMECESLRGSGADLRQFNVKYFAASVDDPETNKRFAESLAIDYPVLSDPDKSVAHAYGVIGPAGFPERWTFFIGKDGRILGIDKAVQVKTHGHDVADRLANLRVPRRKG
jgi:peroxiredoxin Q/BCP